jgi:hypothetical protein
VPLQGHTQYRTEQPFGLLGFFYDGFFVKNREISDGALQALCIGFASWRMGASTTVNLLIHGSLRPSVWQFET